MAKVKKICRICGKEYTPCSYCDKDTMAFHYRKICCSTECAKIYLSRVIEARKTKTSIHDSENVSISVNPVENIDEKSNDTMPTDIDKPKRKYTKKIKEESENSEKIV